jgi:hypothetical protein
MIDKKDQEELKKPFCLNDYCVENAFNCREKLREGKKLKPVIYKLSKYMSEKNLISHSNDVKEFVKDMRKFTSKTKDNNYIAISNPRANDNKKTTSILPGFVARVCFVELVE